MQATRQYLVLSIAVLSTALILTSCSDGGGCGNAAAAPADVTGIWNGTISHGTIGVPISMVMIQNGENVHVTWSGEYPDGTLTGTFDGVYSNGTFTATEEGSVLSLNFSSNTASGSITDSGGTAQVNLTKN